MLLSAWVSRQSNAGNKTDIVVLHTMVERDLLDKGWIVCSIFIRREDCQVAALDARGLDGAGA